MHQKSFAPVNEKPSGVNGCARVDHIGDGGNWIYESASYYGAITQHNRTLISPT